MLNMLLCCRTEEAGLLLLLLLLLHISCREIIWTVGDYSSVPVNPLLGEELLLLVEKDGSTGQSEQL